MNVWQFKTKNFTVSLRIEEDPGYRYDGEDESGETQAKLDSGEFIAFDSKVCVYYRGALVGSDSLGGSVYERGAESEFWTEHRRPHGPNVGFYFLDMIRGAISDARRVLRDRPYIRHGA